MMASEKGSAHTPKMRALTHAPHKVMAMVVSIWQTIY